MITVPTLKRDENGCVQGLSVAVGNGDTLQTSTHSVVFTIGRKNDGQMDYMVETMTVNTEGEDCNSTRYSTSKDAQRGLFDALSGVSKAMPPASIELSVPAFMLNPCNPPCRVMPLTFQNRLLLLIRC